MMPSNGKDLFELADRWDMDVSAALPVPSTAANAFEPEATADKARPFNRLLANLVATAPVRFQPFQNDTIAHFESKLRRWILQFPEPDQRFAFLLASKMIFITQLQFYTLQQQLFESQIRRLLVRDILADRRLPQLAFAAAEPFLEQEMNETLFVANSDSSAINSFVHVNSSWFRRRAKRRLVGPEVRLWTYARRRQEQDPTLATSADDFEQKVIATDPLIAGKKRLVVVEDFSGSGSDLAGTLKSVHASDLPFRDIIVAPAMSTHHAASTVGRLCKILSGTRRRRYEFVTCLTVDDRFRCFHAPGSPPLSGAPYVDDSLFPHLSQELRRMSEECFRTHFDTHTDVDAADEHGFGGLALAFSFHTNTPDNSLPMLWLVAPTWFPLFRRVSNIL